MSRKIYVNKYIRTYQKLDLKWYERPGLLTYIDQIKFKKLIDNPNYWLNNLAVINFYSIHHQCRGDPPENSVK